MRQGFRQLTRLRDKNAMDLSTFVGVIAELFSKPLTAGLHAIGKAVFRAITFGKYPPTDGRPYDKHLVMTAGFTACILPPVVYALMQQ